MLFEPATILILRPRKPNDATEITYEWSEEALKLTKSLGYRVVDLRVHNTTYKNVTEAMEKYHPRMLLDYSHGCPLYLSGQDECTLTKNLLVEDYMAMGRERLSHALEPLKASCDRICKLESDACELLCMKETNVDRMKGAIIFAVACHSASELGQMAIEEGVEAYIGYDDLLLFPKDSMRSQDIFGDVHLLMLNEILIGNTVSGARAKMAAYQDAIIKTFKSVKYLALPMLWDRIHMQILGNQDAMMYRGGFK